MVEIGHELRLAQMLPLHDQRLDQQVGLIQKVVEGRGAQVDLLPFGGGKTGLMQEKSLPVVLDFPGLEIQPEEPENAVALSSVNRRVDHSPDVDRRPQFGEWLGLQNRYLLKNRGAHGPCGSPALSSSFVNWITEILAKNTCTRQAPRLAPMGPASL